MSELQPNTRFHLPAHHLSSERFDYRPQSARDLKEIERRRNRPPNSLILEQQAKGLAIASIMVSGIKHGIIDEDDFTARHLAMTGINTAAYLIGRGSENMTRYLGVPQMFIETEEGHRPISRQELLDRTSQGMFDSARRAVRVFEAHVAGRAESGAKYRLGKNLGQTSLDLGTVDIVDQAATMDVFEAQALARRRSRRLLGESVALAEAIQYPSMAQLAEPDSPLSVYWRKNAPNGSYNLLQYAVSAPSTVEGLFGEGFLRVDHTS